jgi:hypothetical protein
VLEFYKLHEELNDPTDSGIVIDLPVGVIFKMPAEITVNMTIAGSLELPSKTAVVWPKSEGSGNVPKRILEKATKGIDLFWLTEGDSFLLPIGGAVRSQPMPSA